MVLVVVTVVLLLLAVVLASPIDLVAVVLLVLTDVQYCD